MQKLIFILIAFFAIVTFIRAVGEPARVSFPAALEYIETPHKEHLTL